MTRSALATTALLLLCLTAVPASQPAARDLSFPTSGSVDAQREFLRGLRALHNFEYEEANDAFVRAQRIEPGFSMAYWGEAMTYHQPLWGNEDVDKARGILSRLGSTPAARALTVRTALEKAWLAAIEVLFGAGDPASRRADYARALGLMHANAPDDSEIATFYALALLGAVPRGSAGSSDAHEGHSTHLAGSETQTRVGTILERVLQLHPDHPGALHYLLHNYDDPAHAQHALPAARRYARLAPESSHAQHMPAHIFLQLGLWREAALADRAAFTTSLAWVKANGLSPALQNFHALSWLQYELLQRGRLSEAAETVGEIAPLARATKQLPLLNDLASMRAQFVIETRRWDILANERNFANVNELLAIGISAARMRNAALAELARSELAKRAQSAQEGDFRPAVAIMEREVAALIAQAEGASSLAVEILRAAARAEQELPPPLGLPKPMKPAPELLGEVLLELKQPREAIAAFQQALQRNPNRSLSLLGWARAASAIGDTAAARTQYAALLANYDEADAELPELIEARSATNRTP